MFATMEEIEADEWFRSRPPAVQAAIRAKPPGWYRITTTGQLCVILSYEEAADGTCSSSRVFVPSSTARPFSAVLFPDGHQVFGIRHGELEPVDDDDVPPEAWDALNAAWGALPHGDTEDR